MGHTFSQINLHVVFSTKGRLNSLYRDMRSDLLAYFHGIARNEGAEILAVNAVDDHVHLLLGLKPAMAPADIVKKIKANSSRWIHETYANLSEFSWQIGYSVFSVSRSAVKDVCAYIKKQESYHRRIPFEEELQRFLEKHGVEYDPQYYLG